MAQTLIPIQASEGIAASSVLVFAAHPDDEIFGCGGALIRHACAQTPITVIVVTDGAFGVEEAQRNQVIAHRAAESRKAASLVGIGSLEFWNLRDREIAYGEILVNLVIQAVCTHTPDLVYAPSLHEVHPDHCALAMAVIEAIRRIGTDIRLALYEVGAPLRPNVLVDISNIRDQKRAAMQAFVSQNSVRPYLELVEALNRYRSYTLASHIIAAEAFELVTQDDIENNQLGIFSSEYQRRHVHGIPALGQQDLPLISVIVRSVGRPSLTAALDSIARQTYRNVEIVVVNAKGCEHPAMTNTYGGFSVQFIDQKTPMRRAQAANLGMQSARGELLIFLDDDDWFLPHHLAALKTELDATPQAIAAYAAIKAVDQSGHEVKHFEESFDPIQLCIDNYIPIHAVLFRRRVLTEGVRFDETLELCEDWDFWLQVSRLGVFQHIQNVGAVYRLGNSETSGVWSNPLRTRDSMLRIYSKWLPVWSDDIRWSIFEYARYKRLYGELAVTHQQQVGDYKNQIDGYKNQIDNYKNQINGYTNQINDANTQIQSLLTSASWRLTGPIRWLKKILINNQIPSQKG